MEHYALYRRYQVSRHADGSMADDNHHQYAEFIPPRVNSELVEFRDEHGQLKMVSLIDQLADGLSAVYTFLSPTTHPPATACTTCFGKSKKPWRGLSYLYLGYWIAECRKMAYKPFTDRWSD